MNKQQQKFHEKQLEIEHNQQLQKVRELELKARFWKAQYEIRYFTLEAENLQVPYDEYVESQRAKNEKAMKEYEEMLAKLSEEQKEKAAMIDHIVTEEDLRLNPEMATDGVKVGDVIQFPEKPDMTPEEEEMAYNNLIKEHPEYAINN